uniref:Uncharacterized protein n=1 Tax=Timema poppense TaxID=170557 RepID=A0A7R9H7R6_TIMPO|nr:unnamed protein product [Timema poppensis]
MASYMAQDLLTGLALLSVHSEIKVDTDEVITKFSLGPRESDVLDTTTHVLSMASNIQQLCVILPHKLTDLTIHQPGRSIGLIVLARQQDTSYIGYMLLSTGRQPNTLDFQGNVQTCSRKKPSSCDKDWQRDLNIGKNHSLRRSTSVELEAVSSDLDSLLVKYETMFDSRNSPNSWTTPKPPDYTDASIAPPMPLPRIPTTIRDRKMHRLPSSSPNTRHVNSTATDRSEFDHCRLQATKVRLNYIMYPYKDMILDLNPDSFSRLHKH